MVSGINFYLWSWLTYSYCIEKYKESPAALCNSACKISGWLPITKANDKLLYVGKKITPHNGPREGLTNWSLTHWRVPSWPVSPSFFEVGLVARGSNCTVRLRRLPIQTRSNSKKCHFSSFKLEWPWHPLHRRSDVPNSYMRHFVHEIYPEPAVHEQFGESDPFVHSE